MSRRLEGKILARRYAPGQALPAGSAQAPRVAGVVVVFAAGQPSVIPGGRLEGSVDVDVERCFRSVLGARLAVFLAMEHHL